jgi:hypothetical protein
MRALILSLGLLVSSCGINVERPDAPSGSRADSAQCFASADRTIGNSAAAAYVATAYAIGPDCNHTAIMVVVREGENVILTDAVNARDGLIADVAGVSELQARLRTWLFDPTAPTTSGEFPEWAQDSEETTQQTTDEEGRFFTPAVGRRWYARVRSMNVPVFCYARVQGNLTCYAQVNSGLEIIGNYERIG